MDGMNMGGMSAFERRKLLLEIAKSNANNSLGKNAYSQLMDEMFSAPKTDSKGAFLQSLSTPKSNYNFQSSEQDLTVPQTKGLPKTGETEKKSYQGFRRKGERAKEERGGFLDQIVSSAADPFLDAGAVVGDLAFGIGDMVNRRQVADKLIQERGGANKLTKADKEQLKGLSKAKSRFLADEETDRIASGDASIYNDAAKVGLNIGSTVAPFGAASKGLSFGGRAGVRGAQGALGAAGQSEYDLNDERILGDIAVGAGTAAGTGELLDILAGANKVKLPKVDTKGASKTLDNVGRELQRSGLGIPVPNTPKGVETAAQSVDDLYEILGQSKQPATRKGISNTFNSLNDELNTALGGSKASINLSTPVQERADELAFNLSKNPLQIDPEEVIQARALINRELQNVGVKSLDQADAATLAAAKGKLQSFALRVQDKLDRGLQVSNKDLIKYQAYQTIDEAVKGVPGVQPIYSKMAKLYDVSKDFGKSASRGEKVNLPLLVTGTDIPLPAGNIVKGATRAVGTGLRNLSKLDLSKGLQGINLSGITEPIKNIAGNDLIGNLAPNIAARSSINSGNEQIPTDVLPQNDLISQLGGGMDTGAQDRQEIINNALQAGYTPSEAIRIADEYAPKGKTNSDATMGLQVLDGLEATLESNQGAFGPINSKFSTLLPNSKGKQIQDQLNTAAQVIGYMIEGGKLTDDDIERYKRDIIPNINDTPDRAKAKIAYLRQMLALRANGGGGMTPDPRSDYEIAGGY